MKMCRLIDDIKFEKGVLSWLEEEVLILVLDALVIDIDLDLIGKEHKLGDLVTVILLVPCR